MATRSLFSTTPSQQQLGLAIIRIVVGIVFIAHGVQKIFVFGFGGVSGAFAKMGVPVPGLTGPLVALLEFFGGIALIIGLLSRLAALGFAVEMLGAILLIHLANGFFAPTGYEFPLTLFAASIAIAIGGSGSLSIDAAIASRRGTSTVR
jgi:putative oxidoreductase